MADTSNFLVGSDELKITPFYVKNVSIPQVSMNHIKMNTKSGVDLNLGADTLSFDNLDFEAIIDNNFDVYFEIMTKVFQEVDWDHNSFAMPEFNLWVLVLDSNKSPKFKFTFWHSRFNNVGSLPLDMQSELGITIPVSITYDYYTWERYMVDVDECTDIVTKSTIANVPRFYQESTVNTNLNDGANLNFKLVSK